MTATQSMVSLPGTLPGPGFAASAPITFDLTTAPAGVAATSTVLVEITLRHTSPDDIRLALQSPAGTTVALMFNTGGSTDIPVGTVLTFADSGPALPDATAITTGTYRPTTFATVTLPSPAPAAPYETTLAAFVGRTSAARGSYGRMTTWRATTDRSRRRP